MLIDTYQTSSKKKTPLKRAVLAKAVSPTSGPAKMSKPIPVKDAKHKLLFTITAEHIKIAKLKDPCYCVIAQAIRNSAIGEMFETIEVGATSTKVYTGSKVMRYSTPKQLGRALRVFDETGLWNLPTGTYALNPPTGVQRMGAAKMLSTSRDLKTTSKAKTRKQERASAPPSRLVTRAPKHRLAELN